MKKSPPKQNRTEIGDWDARDARKPAQDEAQVRRAEEEIELIVFWRREIASAGNVSEETKRTVAQLSNFELALYLAGKRQREKFRKPARRDLFEMLVPAAAVA